MIQPGTRSPGDAEKGAGRPGPDSDSPSLSEGVDLEKRSGEDMNTGRTSTDTSDVETTEEDRYPASRQRTWDGGLDGADGAHSGVLSRAISRVVTRVSTKSSWNPGPPPDGGLQAWTAGKPVTAPSSPSTAYQRPPVACGHLVIMNTWGIVNSFGLFQTHYTATLNRSPSDVSWIGSLQIFLLFFIGAFTGRLTDAGYFRHVFVLGIAFNLVGIFTASVATQYWQVVLAQGICMGLGNGCLFCPTISTVSTYFNKRRSLALGMTACGSATGGLVFPSMVRELVPAQGFPAAMRAIGYVQVATFAVALVGLKQRIPPRRSGPLVEWSAFREPEYTLFAMAAFSVSLLSMLCFGRGWW